MKYFLTARFKNLSLFFAGIVSLLFVHPNQVSAQITVNGGFSASALAAKLTGTGVTVFGATLTCPAEAYGDFHVVSSSFGLDSGIVLTNGLAATPVGSGPYGVNIIDGLLPSGDFANNTLGAPGDADLSALCGQPTFDACVLEFNFKPAGDTVKFRYVFGSEEYTSFTCSPFNDVFGFLITGGAYTTPTNLALVPGTSIPVCINSVNCGATGGYSTSTCSALGPGSPFCAYYVDNSSSTTSFITYDGITTVLTAVVAVSPCDTYHLKLGVADASDDALDSGVFIEGGSLSSNTTSSVTATGTSGLPYCIRNCAPGNFVFRLPTAQDTAYPIHYLITGTAVNGYDYASIPTTVTIPPLIDSTILYINTLPVSPAGPKVITLEIQVPDPCHPGLYTTGALASLTILDSFSFRIVTSDTQICNGQNVHLNAIGDSIFDSILHYSWTPSSTISNDTILTPIATPTISTTYTLTGSTAAVLGCAPESRSVTVRVYNRPILTIDSPVVRTCQGIPVDLHVYANPDSVPNTYVWAPGTDLSSTTIYNPVVDPAVPGDVIYTITVNPTAVPGCSSSTNIHVHTVPNDFILSNPDTVICIGESVQTRVTGSSEFVWRWTPTAGVSNAVIMQPVITPVTTAIYTVTASYGHCPDMVHSFRIEVDSPAPPKIFTDTICLGMSDSFNLTAPGTDYYHYQWTPPDYLTNDTIPNPVITPTITGYFTYAIVIQPHAASCAITDSVYLLVVPNSVNISPHDTAICYGQAVQVIGTPYPLFHYQWLPTAGIAYSTEIAPLITPDTSATYVVTASFRRCPDMHDTLRLDVQPIPSVYIGGNRFMCEYDSVHIPAYVSPTWYTHYHYSWTPAGSLDSTTSPIVLFTGNVTAEVRLTVTTPAGCISGDSALVTVHPGDFATLPPLPVFCPHDTLVLQPEGGTSYHWFPSLYISDSLGNTPTLAPITSQSYSVIATSQYGCKDTLYFTATVQAGAVINLGDSMTLYPGETYHIEPQTNCSVFSWFPPAGLDNAHVSDPVASPVISTKYIVDAQTEWGCKTRDSINIYVDPESTLVLPNAFTPGSGPNNEFKIIKKGIATLKYFRIFNRWGNIVFETDNIDKGWDGQFNGVPQPFGVYVYEVEAVTSTGRTFSKHGNLTLIR